MRAWVGLIVIGAGLAGCHATTDVTASNARSGGRYSGVGVFDAGRAWAHVKRSGTPTDADSATLADDEHIIVVQDSVAGEVRQCGDHSGYCLAMQPWRSGSAQTPAALDKHVPQIIADQNAKGGVYNPDGAAGNGP